MSLVRGTKFQEKGVLAINSRAEVCDETVTVEPACAFMACLASKSNAVHVVC